MSHRANIQAEAITVVSDPVSGCATYEHAPRQFDWEALCVGGKLHLFGYWRAHPIPARPACMREAVVPPRGEIFAGFTTIRK